MKTDTNFLHDRFFALIEATAKEFYFNVLSHQTVALPALNGVLVSISRQGWNHLRLGEKQRSKRVDLLTRYFALPKIIPVLCNSAAAVVNRRGDKDEFWALSSIIDGVRIKVVVRSRAKGTKHFYSVIWQG